MKIAILTQPLVDNYGGILQCYALQTVLEEMGHQATVLNRRNLKWHLTKSITKWCLLRLKGLAVRSPWKNSYKAFETKEIGLRKMRGFVKKNIHLTKPLRSSKELAKWVGRHGYDGIVVGSDQVWREKYSPDIEDFFLGFLPEDDKRLKITYAASFGTADSPISEAHLSNCVRLSKRFDALSVREQSGVEILKETFGLEARLVLDPTLLLSTEQYKFPVKSERTGGIVSYILDETEDKNSIIGQVAKNLGLKEIKVRISTRSSDADTLLKPSVEEWLASFASAEFVVTDSFHGCVFSIVNHKPFIAIANNDRGLERFTSLLGSFGLMDRLIFSHEEFERKKTLLLQPIDYEPVNAQRQELIQGSLEFLTCGLKLQQLRRKC